MAGFLPRERRNETAMLDKTYQPSAVEARIYAAWEAAGAFRCGRPERRDARPYCIVIPPPNVTGSLHMGHALNNTLQDILARFERMRGRDVLWQPGTDHAGIATQMVVERQLMERQEPPRRVLGREKFLEKVWAWKAEAGGTITQQLRRLGASCDWSRERFTMDEGLSRAVRKAFVELYRAGLIYKDKPLVGRSIPIIADEYSDPEKGTGAVKITPAHDFNDFEVGRRHDVPLVNVLDAQAHLKLAGNEAFLRDVPSSPELDATLAYDGLDRFAVRKEIVHRLEAAALLAKIESHTHTVPHGDRS